MDYWSVIGTLIVFSPIWVAIVLVLVFTIGHAYQRKTGQLPGRQPPPVPYPTPEELRRQQARMAAGVRGEARTAKLLDALGPGWHVLHDRALPRGRANIDHLVVAPSGAVINIDSKQWSTKRGNVHVRGRRLFHGPEDRTSSIDAARYESQQAARALGVPVATVIAVHGARITGGHITLPGLLVVPAPELTDLLRQLDSEVGPPNPAAARPLAQRAARLLPPYPHHTR